MHGIAERTDDCIFAFLALGQKTRENLVPKSSQFLVDWTVWNCEASVPVYLSYRELHTAYTLDLLPH